MGCESFDVVRFDLGPLLHGQMRIATLKGVYMLTSSFKMLFIFEIVLVVLFRWIHLTQMRPWSS